MATTTRGVSYPASGDVAAGHTQIQAIADWIDAEPGIHEYTTGERDALGAGAKPTGIVIYNSTTGRLERWNGSAWKTLVEQDTTDTLTNKTLTAPVVTTPLIRADTNPQTGTVYTLALADEGKVVELLNASAITLTVPTNATVAFPVGSQVTLLATGAGQVTVGGAGVTINGTPGLKLRAQWSSATLIKRATDTWVLVGDLTA